MKRVIATVRATAWPTAGVLILAATLGAGCGAGPKSPPLVELEQLRDSAYSRTVRINPAEVEQPRVAEIRQRAATAVAESDRYYGAAIEAWESGNSDVSEEYASQGLILYRAAEAYARSADARERIEGANATYQLQLERRNRYDDMARANEEVINLLTALQTLYDETEDCRADMAAVTAEAQARQAAEFLLQEARWEQRQAQNNGADSTAGTVYNEGVRLLAEAAGYFDGSQFDRAYTTAETAQARFREAQIQSQSQIDSRNQRMLRSSRNDALFSDAVELFGERATVDGRGLVVSVPNLFADRRTDIRSDMTYVLDQVAGLLNEHSRFDVVIEGHTSDSGSRDSNVAVSRARAEAVRDYLLRQDVRSRRMTTTSYGEDFPRYSNRDNAGRDNNNRVELVFPMSE